MLKILVVDDDPLMHERVINCFSLDEAQVTVAHDVPEAKAAMKEDLPEICLLDLGLPGTNGRVFCKEIGENYEVGVIVVSATDARHEQIKLLDLGADDYIVKPFDDLELRARVSALSRRLQKRPSTTNREEFAGNTFRFEERRLTRADGATITLTMSESQILRFMLNNPEAILSRDDLLAVARMRQHGGTKDRSVDNLVSRLRQKVEIDPSEPRHIVTIWGRGYRFQL